MEVNMNKLGHCYELSFKYVMDNPDWLLVHGYITNKYPPYQTIDHAWCMKDDVVYDCVWEQEFPLIVYEGLFNAKIEKQYTKEEALELSIKSDGRLIWHEIKESESDKYYDEEGRILEEYKHDNQNK